MAKLLWVAVTIALLVAGLGCRYRPETPLAVVAAAGDIDRVEELLADGAEVDAVDGSGMTALAWAARSGQVEVIHLLVTRGAAADRVAASDGGPGRRLGYRLPMARLRAPYRDGAGTPGRGPGSPASRQLVVGPGPPSRAQEGV